MAAATEQPRWPQYEAARSSHSAALAARPSSRSRTERRSAACARRSLEKESWPRSSSRPRLARASSRLPRRWYTMERLIALAAMPSASSTDRASRIASRYCLAAPSRSPARRYASALRFASNAAISPGGGGLEGGGATHAARSNSGRTARKRDLATGIGCSALGARATVGRLEAVYGQAAHGLRLDVVPQQP